jgi:beta-N-acetylhexosaminidase
MPILIDQEGGRVARLRPPEWRQLPPMAALEGLVEGGDLEPARRAAFLIGRLIAFDLREVGITIDCAPVLDLRLPNATRAIGDRAFSGDPRRVAALGEAVADGLVAGGLLPVIKHLPGHGRARVDSHLALPVVDASLGMLQATDFVPFRQLARLPLAMTAHVVFTAIDPERPATLSPRVIAEIIRGMLEFDGLLLSDDLAMGALDGPPEARALAALAAGCDLALYCAPDLRARRRVLAAVPPMGHERWHRLQRALAAVAEPDTLDPAVAEREATDLLLRA